MFHGSQRGGGIGEGGMGGDERSQDRGEPADAVRSGNEVKMSEGEKGTFHSLLLCIYPSKKERPNKIFIIPGKRWCQDEYVYDI